MTTNAQMLDGLAAMLEAANLTLDDLAAHLAGRAAGGPDVGARPYPTLADHVEAVRARLPRNTKRTWATHYNRLLTGTAAHCDCTCDACLDLESGCACGCRACIDKLAIPAQPGLILVRGAIRKSDIDRYVKVAKRMASKKAVRDNQGRARRGLVAKPVHGKGGAENAVTAYRHLFGVLVEDDIWGKNPALAVKKPGRDDTKRRALRDTNCPSSSGSS
jgi:hypothetical protein